MNWIMIIIIANTHNVTAEFETERACKSAGRTITKDIGEKAVYWCVAKTD